MKKIILPLLFGIVLLVQCNQESMYRNNYSLEPTKDLKEFEIGDHSKNLSECIQYVNDNDTSYLAVLNRKINSIEYYSLITGNLTKETPIKVEGDNSFYKILAFLVKSPDSILVVSQMPQFIGIVNGKGEVLKKIEYVQDVSGKAILPTHPLLGARPLLLGSSLLLSQSYRTDQTKGILTEDQQKKAYLNVAIDLKKGNCLVLPLVYPASLIGKDVSGIRIFRTLSPDHEFIYHFGNINGLFVSKNGVDFKQVQLETNYNLRFLESRWRYLNDYKAYERVCLANDEVQDILYDNYRQCYYIIVRQRMDQLDAMTDFQQKFLFPHCFIIILDKNLKHMGELYLPDNTYSVKMVFIAPEGLYISEDHPANLLFNENKMRFRMFKLKKL
jgi:hypothetical protein